jgi:hypothetical protein
LLPAGASEADAAVVLTVSVAVTDPVPVIAAGWVTEQTGGSTEPAGLVTVHERATLPVKPPLGVTVIVEVPVAPGEAMVTVVLVRVKFGGRGGAVTVRGTWVVTGLPPDAPVTVIVYEPAVVAACVATVSVAVTARVPVMVACGLMEQVGAPVPPEGPALTEH